MALSFWRLTAFAYGVWFVAQGFSVYHDVAASPVVSGIENFLFCLLFAPLAMAIFLDPDTESGELDALVALDFVQAVLVCVAAYLYFFYIPKSESGEKAHLGMGSILRRLRTGRFILHYARRDQSHSRCANPVRTDGNVPRRIGVRGPLLLLRPGTGSAYRPMVRSSVGRAAGDSNSHRDFV